MADVDLGTVKARLDIDTALVNQRVDEVLAAWKSIQTGTGNLTTNMTRKMVEGITQYQQKLDILAAKLEKQRQLITQLEAASNKPVTGQNSQAEVAKETAQLDKEKIKLKELEAQFDRTYASQQNFILQQDKTAKKVEEVNVKLDNKEAGANFKVGTDLAASGLRTLDQIAPGVAGNIGNIVTQINTARAAMQGMSSTPMKWAMGLSAAIGVATTLVVAGIQKVQKKEEERQKAFEEGVEKTKEYAQQFATIESNVRILKDEKSTVDEVRSAREALTSTFPDLIAGYDAEGKAILANDTVLQEYIETQKESARIARESISANANDNTDAYNKAVSKLEHWKRIVNEATDGQKAMLEAGNDIRFVFPDIITQMQHNGEIGIFESLPQTLDDVNKKIAEEKQWIQKLTDESRSAFMAQVQGAIRVKDEITGLTVGWEDLSSAQRSVAQSDIMDYAYSHIDEIMKKELTAAEVAQEIQNKLNDPSKMEEATESFEKQARLTEILSDDHEQQAVSAQELADAYQILANGGEIADETMRALINVFPQLKQYLEETGDLSLNTGKALADAIGQIDYSEQLNQLNELSAAYQTLSDGQQLSVKQLYDLAAAYPEVASYIAQTNDLTLDGGQILQQVFEVKRQDYIASLQQDREVAESAKQRAQEVVDSLSAQITAYEADIKLKAVETGRVDGRSVFKVLGLQKQLTDAEKNLEKDLNKYQKDIDAANAKIAAAQSKVASISSFAGSKGSSKPKSKSNPKPATKPATKSDRNEALAAELKQLDQKKRMDQLTSQEEIAWLERIQKKYKMNTDEKYDLEYRLYSAKKKYEQELEQAATERLNAEYKAIENKKALGELSAKEELAWLERIQQTFRMNKEEQMELEIKLYNLKKQLHEEDVAALDKIGDVVTEALKNKYEEQKKAEQDRINESIQSWQDWEDETCKAIQGQIDALDELEKQQESEEKRAEYEKKRQATELMLRYEKDEYQRKQLKKQLAQLDAEEQKRLDEEARKAERERLEQEMETTKETSQKQQDALKEELEDLDKTYDELTKDFALRAEAEKAIMNSTQKEIVDLIKSYAPEYDLAGQSIGQKLADGFKAKAGSIVDYLDGLMKKVQEYQANIAYTANQAADKFWADRKKYEQQIAASVAPPVVKTSSPVVNMTVQINQPVQSPIEMRRQLERVADQIGRQLGG